MKNSLLTKSFVCALIVSVCSCATKGEIDTDVLLECDEGGLLLELTETIPAKISLVESGEPFYKGVKTYY